MGNERNKCNKERRELSSTGEQRSPQPQTRGSTPPAPATERRQNMESVLALIISIVGLAGMFFVGVRYGKDLAYDEAIRDTAKLYNEIYKEDTTWK